MSMKQIVYSFLISLSALSVSTVIAQSEGPTISSLFDSMATQPEIHQGPFGFTSQSGPRSLWLDSLISRRSEWFSLDSLMSPRVTTRAITLLSLDPNNVEQNFTAFAKTMGDTARIAIGRGCVIFIYTIGELASGSLYQTFLSADKDSKVTSRQKKIRKDSMLLASDRIAGRGQLNTLVKLYYPDTSRALQHLRRVYNQTDEGAALGLIMGYGMQSDSTLFIERISRDNKRDVTAALVVYDANRHAQYLRLVRPEVLRLSPTEETSNGPYTYDASIKDQFYRALLKAIWNSERADAEPLLIELEKALPESEIRYWNNIVTIREEWESASEN